jgi:hypothetical protein
MWAKTSHVTYSCVFCKLKKTSSYQQIQTTCFSHMLVHPWKAQAMKWSPKTWYGTQDN